MSDQLDLEMREEGSITLGRVLGTKAYVLIQLNVDDRDQDETDDGFAMSIETGGGIPPGDIAEVADLLEAVAAMLREDALPVYQQRQAAEAAGS